MKKIKFVKKNELKKIKNKWKNFEYFTVLKAAMKETKEMHEDTAD